MSSLSLLAGRTVYTVQSLNNALFGAKKKGLCYKADCDINGQFYKGIRENDHSIGDKIL